MRCQDSQQRLDAYLDGELSDPEVRAVSAHLGHCPACQAALDERRWLATLLDSPDGRTALSMPAQPLPADFTQRLLQQLPPARPAAVAQGPVPETPQLHQPDPVNLLWPWLQRRWSTAQVASLVYAMGTTVAVAAAAVLVLRTTAVRLEQLDGAAISDLGAGARDYWFEVQVGLDVMSAGVSQFWHSLLSLVS